METRATRVTILLPDFHTKTHSEPLEVNVVEVLERSARDDRLQWVLLTNEPIDRLADIERVVASYKTRWRVEDFHRTWKSGACGLEDIRIRCMNPVSREALAAAIVRA